MTKKQKKSRNINDQGGKKINEIGHPTPNRRNRRHESLIDRDFSSSLVRTPFIHDRKKKKSVLASAALSGSRT